MADFTQPYIESGLVVVAPVRRVSSGTWAFFRPFTAELWCVIGICFLVVGAVVWILEHRRNDEFRGTPRQQVVTTLWYVCVCVLKEGNKTGIRTSENLLVVNETHKCK